MNAQTDAKQSFFQLTPDRVMKAVESSGLICTGRCDTLNSFENRVYDIEVEHPETGELSKIVAKFYRPGRWSREQILDEHQFLSELNQAEIPVIAPLLFPNSNETLRTEPESDIHYCLFPKQGGRSPDELTPEHAAQVGRLIARIHNVGATQKAQARISLSVEEYGRKNLKTLLDGHWIPPEFQSRYVDACEKLFEKIEAPLKNTPTLRLHGDCHLGNLLWGRKGAFFVDFDDMVTGPAVQDLWLLIPGRDETANQTRELLLEGYESLRDFNRAELRLIEPLRALRFIHYTTWLARRWDDPAFPKAFPHFNSPRYWEEETRDLESELLMIQNSILS